MFDMVTFGGVTQDTFMKMAPQSARLVEDGKSDANFLCFEYGAKIEMEDAYSGVGGGALNTALCYKELGFHPVVVSAIGADHYGKNVLLKLSEHDIPDRFIIRVAGIHTGLSVILTTPGGDRTVFVYRGANDHITRSALPSFHELAQAKWFTVSHLSGKSDHMLRDIAHMKDENSHIKIAWNPGHTQLAKGAKALESFLQRTKVLFLNRREAEMLSGKKAERDSQKGLKKIAQYLGSFGPEMVVISDGAKGAVAYAHHTLFTAPTFPAHVMNTTGAGDSFVAGFVAGLHHGRDDIEVALAYGSANAATVVSHLPTHKVLPSVQELQEKIRRTTTFQIKKERV